MPRAKSTDTAESAVYLGRGSMSRRGRKWWIYYYNRRTDRFEREIIPTTNKAEARQRLFDLFANPPVIPYRPRRRPGPPPKTPTHREREEDTKSTSERN